MVKRGRVQLLTINDVYSLTPQGGLGGYAELATLIKRYRDPSIPSLFFVNGDFLAGSAIAEAVKGKHAIDILNHLNVDAVVLGNHEFDFGTGVLEERIAESKFTWLGSNVIEKATKEVLKGVSKTKIVEKEIPLVGGGKTVVRIGLFGVCTPATPYLSFPGDRVSFLPIIETSRASVTELQNAGADLIICISHVQLEEDLRLAREVKGIDVILGGHDHIPHTTMEGNTLVMKCGQNAYWLGVVDMILTIADDVAPAAESAKVESQRVSIVPSWRMEPVAFLEPEEACKEIIVRYTELYSQIQQQKAMEECGGDADALHEVLAIISGEYSLDTRSSTVRRREGTGGNLVADAMLFKNKGADLAIINGGDMRADREYPFGSSFTRKDLLAELPYESPVVTVKIKGAGLIEGLEQMLSLAKGSGSFPHLSTGCHLKYQQGADKMKVCSFTLAGKPVKADEYYTVAITDYIAQGGDHISAFTKGVRLPRSENDPPSRTSRCVLEYLKQRPSKYYEPILEKRVEYILPNNLDGQVHSFI